MFAEDNYSISFAGNILSIESYNTRLDYNLESGVFNITDKNGEFILRNARCEAVISSGGEKSTLTLAGAGPLKWSQEEFKIRALKRNGKLITIFRDSGSGAVAIKHTIRLYESRYIPNFEFGVTVENGSKAPIGIERLSPVVADDKQGGAALTSAKSDNIRILENGHKLQLDFWVRLVPATAGSDSNWISTARDLQSGRTLIGGFLTQTNAMGSVITGAEKGGNGLNYYHARAAFSPIKKLDASKSLSSDPFLLVYVEKDALTALSNFGSEVFLSNCSQGLCRPFIPVSFWDTWYSQYNEAISEEIILKNLDVVAEKLKPYGMNTFEIDAGWEQRRGDWFPNERFPSGMQWIAHMIKSKGLTPAIWIAPFSVNIESKTYKEHPDWFLEPDTLGKIIIPSDTRALDISKHEVKQWLKETIDRIANKWGFEIIKVDFTYHSLTGKSYSEKGRTRTEIFRDAYNLIAEELPGPNNRRILAVGVPLGYHAGLVNMMRTGLDNAPQWGEESGYAAAGFLPSYRAFIRRFYLNWALWSNDPDCIYTGLDATFKRWGRPAMPENELVSWISALALSGTTLELADAPVNMTDDMLRLVRAALPVTMPYNFRPVDLFRNENPELLLSNYYNDFENWSVLGVFNWGQNGGQSSDGSKAINIDFNELGLDASSKYHVFEFWSNSYLGTFTSSMTRTLPRRSAEVLCFRKVLDHPQFIGTNRHITSGAADMTAFAWDEKKLTLKGTLIPVPGFKYVLTFHVPENYQYKVQVSNLQDVNASQPDERGIMTVTAAGTTPLTGKTSELELRFSLK